MQVQTHRTLLAVATSLVLWFFLTSSLLAQSAEIVTDTTWRAIAPVGNLEGQPISSVGLAWESSHPSWNTDLSYDDSDSAGWSMAILNQQVPSWIWIDGNGTDGSTPAYFRRQFSLAATPLLAILDVGADDDVQVYLNGILVCDDQNGFAGYVYGTNVTAQLHAGQNLIAMKAHDSFGSSESVWTDLKITVPEPSALVLLVLGSVVSMRRGY